MVEMLCGFVQLRYAREHSRRSASESGKNSVPLDEGHTHNAAEPLERRG